MRLLLGPSSFNCASRIVLTRFHRGRCVFASFLAAFLLRTRLTSMNRRNAEAVRAIGVPEKKAAEGATEEIWDNDPRYVFMT